MVIRLDCTGSRECIFVATLHHPEGILFLTEHLLSISLDALLDLLLHGLDVAHELIIGGFGKNARALLAVLSYALLGYLVSLE